MEFLYNNGRIKGRSFSVTFAITHEKSIIDLVQIRVFIYVTKDFFAKRGLPWSYHFSPPRA